MASKILRKTMQQFGGSLAAAGNVAVFGSQAAGIPAYSLDPTVIQSLTQYLQGWSAAVFGNNAPAKQDRNALDYLFSYQLGYLLQMGMAEWDSVTPYFQYSFCQVNGVVYVANQANTGVNPVTDVNSQGIGTNWSTYAALISSLVVPPNSPGIAKAWCYFSGTTGQIFSSFNIFSVGTFGTGNYLVTFNTAMADSNYCVVTGQSTDANAPFDPLVRLNGDIKTPSSVQLRNLNGNNLSGWGNNQENYVAIYR